MDKPNQVYSRAVAELNYFSSTCRFHKTNSKKPSPSWFSTGYFVSWKSSYWWSMGRNWRGKSREFPFYGSGPMSDSRIVVFAADQCLELVIRNKMLLTIINFDFCWFCFRIGNFFPWHFFHHSFLSTDRWRCVANKTKPTRGHRISLWCLKQITYLSFLELFDNYFQTINLCQTLLTDFLNLYFHNF